MDKSVKLANHFYGENIHGKAIHKLLKGNWDTSKVQSYLEKLGGGDDTKWVGILDFISKYVKLDTTQYDTMGEQLPVLLDRLESLYGAFVGGGVNESRKNLKETSQSARLENMKDINFNDYKSESINESNHRPLYQIADEIRQDWGSKVNYAAKPYLDAMGSLDSAKDNYIMDPGWEIVARFLANARQWRGETAKKIKKELKAILKDGMKGESIDTVKNRITEIKSKTDRKSKIKSLIETMVKDELNSYVNENLQQNNIEIEISKIEPDERSNRKPVNKFHINYQITIGGKLMEIEGILTPYHTGRSEEHEFEPTYFMDDETEEYYDNNWENIEDEILNKFSEGNF